MGYFKLVLVIAMFLISESSSQLSRSKYELLNWCLKSKNHKSSPGKEDILHRECEPWKDHACCTESISRDLHNLNIYNFTYDHCYDKVKQNMSAQCKKHFIRDNCFYECEPHIGFWVVNTTRKISSERFYKVPLCASDCDVWFEDCKDDFTCAYNWPQDFKFKNGSNYCPSGSRCVTFKDMYKNSKDFCENVWDHSWEYTKDEHCMHVWFNAAESDINKKAAEYYIDKYFNANIASTVSLDCRIMVFVAILAISWKSYLFFGRF